MSLFATLYAVATIGLAIYGFNGIVFSIIFLWLRWAAPRRARTDATYRVSPITDWPSVTIQLPIYNERYVVERLIETVVALDYPADRLHIQVLDDSPDDTVALARAKGAQCRARGGNIEYIQRPPQH